MTTMNKTQKRIYRTQTEMNRWFKFMSLLFNVNDGLTRHGRTIWSMFHELDSKETDFNKHKEEIMEMLASTAICVNDCSSKIHGFCRISGFPIPKDDSTQ